MNNMKVEFEALPENEGFARVAVAAFLTPLNPTLEEIEDVKTAVSEAVTNAVIHGYKEQGGTIEISCVLEKDLLKMEIIRSGSGIENVEQAMEPMFTTRPDLERSGMGFSLWKLLWLPGGGIDRGAGDACDSWKRNWEMRRGSVIRIRKRSSTWKYQY